MKTSQSGLFCPHLLFFGLPVNTQPLQNSLLVVSCQRILGRLVVRVLLQVFEVLLDYPPELAVLALLARWLLMLGLLVELPDARSCCCRRILRPGCCRLRLLACGWLGVVVVALQHLREILPCHYPVVRCPGMPCVQIVASHSLVDCQVNLGNISLAVLEPSSDCLLAVFRHQRQPSHCAVGLVVLLVPVVLDGCVVDFAFLGFLLLRTFCGSSAAQTFSRKNFA